MAQVHVDQAAQDFSDAGMPSSVAAPDEPRGVQAGALDDMVTVHGTNAKFRDRIEEEDKSC